MLGRILRLSLGSQEAASCSLSDLCCECGSTGTCSLFASPMLNSLVHVFSLFLKVFRTWQMFKNTTGS